MLIWTLTLKVPSTAQSRYRYRPNCPIFWRSLRRLPSERNQPTSFSGQQRKWRVRISWSNTLACNKTCAFPQVFPGPGKRGSSSSERPIGAPSTFHRGEAWGDNKGCTRCVAQAGQPHTHTHTHTHTTSSHICSVTPRMFYTTSTHIQTHIHVHSWAHKFNMHTYTCTAWTKRKGGNWLAKGEMAACRMHPI